MIKRKITYVDFNGKTQTKDFYFHITTAELLELENELPGGSFKELFDTFGSEENPNFGAILSAFRLLVGASYGKKSADGQSFEKDDKITKSFTQSPAYDVWFWSLFENEGAGAMEFFNGLVPKDLPSWAKEAME